MATLPAHGVLIQLDNTGVYLIGSSGIGKSEIALQLIHEGAILICDDAPEIAADRHNKKITGTCPEGFQGLMHIHDLGIINVCDLISRQACKTSQQIDIVIELMPSDNQALTIASQDPQQLLAVHYRQWHYQCCSIPGIRIHLYPCRNLPLIIKTAIKQFKLFSDRLPE